MYKSQISIRARYTTCIRRNSLFNRRVIYCEQQIRWSCCHSDKSLAPIALKSPIYARYFIVSNRLEQSRSCWEWLFQRSDFFIRTFRWISRRSRRETWDLGDALADVPAMSYLMLGIVTLMLNATARSTRHNSFPRERDCSRWLWKRVTRYISKLGNSRSTSSVYVD